MDKKPFDPLRYRRRTVRLPKHDYTWTGAYFITIRAQQHEPVFEIPELRALLLETWQDLPRRFPGVTLDEFVVMPDHVHTSFSGWMEHEIMLPYWDMWLERTNHSRLCNGSII